MNVLVIGGGGREHALAWRLARSRRFEHVFASPGNPGISRVAKCIAPSTASPHGYLEIARSVDADLTVVGPEAPLVAGVVDVFRKAGLAIVGPTSQAARLEGSKAFSKAFMQRAGVPTAGAATAPDPASAARHVGDFGYPVVLKADGLAAGKGVIIADNEPQALEALGKLPPGPIVIEEFLQGEEVSFIVIVDGEHFQVLEATQDHKAIGDGDIGPNTGGMGAYCDGRILSAAQAQEIVDLVIRPTLTAMAAEGTPYTGFLYAGLMMTPAGPKVLEYNARLGDPETQVLMHRMDCDFGDVLLDRAPLRWRADPSVCVVLAALGYPGDVRTGDAIDGLDVRNESAVEVFQAGTRLHNGVLETAGGRVLGVTASGSSLRSAIDNTYRAVANISFDGMHYRKDIGAKGLKRWPG